MVPRWATAVLAAGTLSLVWVAQPTQAQQRLSLAASGYAINVGVVSGDSPFASGGVSDFQRLREMLTVGFGSFSVDLAYEQTFLAEESPGEGVAGLRSPNIQNNWWDLSGTITEGDHVTVRHRVDRAAVTYAQGSVEATAGRQVISWASTLFLTPADPFAPFDPADPFREYRAGIDALRVRWYVGPFSEIDFVVRPTRDATEDRITALVRATTNVGGWDISAWGGALFDRAAASVEFVGALGSWAVRSEVSLRDQEDGGVLRTAIGVDRRLLLAERELYLVLEYQRDGFGATEGDLPEVLLSAPAARGELQVFSRDVFATQASYRLTPLVGLDALVLWSLNDGSLLFGPGLSWSASSAASVRVGGYLAFGEESPTTLASEFGSTPTLGYISASIFF